MHGEMHSLIFVFALESVGQFDLMGGQQVGHADADDISFGLHTGNFNLIRKFDLRVSD